MHQGSLQTYHVIPAAVSYHSGGCSEPYSWLTTSDASRKSVAALEAHLDIGLDFVGQYPNLDIGSGASLALPCLAPFGPVLALGGHRLLAAALWPCAGLALAFDLALCWPRFLRF